jgi:hypothetical protein
MAQESYDQDFPNWRETGIDRTSDPDYPNCIAYAAGDARRSWWPGDYPPNSRDYWPPNIPNEETVEAFSQAFATLGYVSCVNGDWEPGYEKVALYAQRNEVRHAARQQPDGTWRSKLGKDEDVEHKLKGLEDGIYGKVVAFLKRPLAGAVFPPEKKSLFRRACLLVAGLISQIWKRN